MNSIKAAEIGTNNMFNIFDSFYDSTTTKTTRPEYPIQVQIPNSPLLNKSPFDSVDYDKEDLSGTSSRSFSNLFSEGIGHGYRYPVKDYTPHSANSLLDTDSYQTPLTDPVDMFTKRDTLVESPRLGEFGLFFV